VTPADSIGSQAGSSVGQSLSRYSPHADPQLLFERALYAQIVGRESHHWVMTFKPSGASRQSARHLHHFAPVVRRRDVVAIEPSLSSTRNDGAFQARTVDQSRLRPVAVAASRTARAASVA
jgi:hypothetical protein